MNGKRLTAIAAVFLATTGFAAAQAVNPGAGGARGTSPGTSADQQESQSGQLSLSAQQRQLIFSEIQAEPQTAPSGLQLRVGTALPAAVTVQPVPQAIVTEIPQVRQYHYAMIGDQMVFVEPGSRRIVTVIER